MYMQSFQPDSFLAFQKQKRTIIQHNTTQLSYLSKRILEELVYFSNKFLQTLENKDYEQAFEILQTLLRLRAEGLCVYARLMKDTQGFIDEEIFLGEVHTYHRGARHLLTLFYSHTS